MPTLTRVAAGFVLATLAFAANSSSAAADDYPTRPVRIIVGFTPAGATDILARLIGQWLQERLVSGAGLDWRTAF